MEPLIPDPPRRPGVKGRSRVDNRSIFSGRSRIFQENINSILFSDWGACTAIFLSCMFVYLIFWSGHQYSIDGIVMFQYAKALLFQRSFVMSPPVRWEDVEFLVCRWPLGLTFTYIPVLAVLSSLPKFQDASFKEIPYNIHEYNNPVLINDRAYHYSSFVNPLITAFTTVLLFYFGRQLGLSRSKSAAASLVFGLASPAAVYARYDFAQPLASFLLLAAVFFMFRSFSRGRAWIVVSGLLLSLSFLTRSEMILLAGPVLTVAALLRGMDNTRTFKFPLKQKIKDVSFFLLPVIAGILISLYLNYLRFGDWLQSGYGLYSSLFILRWDHLVTGLLGNVVSPGRGILIFYPVGLFSLPGIAVLYRRHRLEGALLGLMLVCGLALYSAWYQWAAGLSWGPRFLIPLFPYLTVLAFFGYDSLSKFPEWSRKAMFLFLIGLGWLATIQGQLFDFSKYYGALSLSIDELTFGNYHFDIFKSPIINGWSGLLNPSEYDVHWFQAGRLSRSRIVFFPAALLILSIIGVYWGKFFYRLQRKTEWPPT